MSRFLGTRNILSLDGGGPTRQLVGYKEGSSQATLDLDLVFTDEYETYDIYITNAKPVTSAAVLYLRFGTGSPTVTYDSGNNYKDDTTTRSFIDLSFAGGSTVAGETMSSKIIISNAANGSLPTFASVATVALTSSGAAGGSIDKECYTLSNVVTSCQIYFSTGNIDTIRTWTYGLNKQGVSV